MSTLLIVGASARAAAMSARRAGLSPWCADLFADSDLRAVVPDAVRCPADRYPSAFLELVKSAPDAPLMYTGGLENHPRLIEALAALRPLWGNGPESLAAARSPFAVEQCLHKAGLPALEVRSGDDNLPANSRWLRKPLAGSAGQGIAFADTVRESPAGRHYFQRYVDGIAMSAVFVRAGGDVRLFGITEQLIGIPWLNAPPFRYAGNVGPIDVPATVRRTVEKIGMAIGEACGLLGLFGIDFVLEEDTPWVVEVNPRYPASVEVFEAATGNCALALHRRAFDPSAAVVDRQPSALPVWGKAIVYSARRLRITLDLLDPSGPYVDVPSPGEIIEPGWPIVSILTGGTSRQDCLGQCQRWSQQLTGAC